MYIGFRMNGLGLRVWDLGPLRFYIVRFRSFSMPRDYKASSLRNCLIINTVSLLRADWFDMGVSENRGPWYSIPNSRILTIRTPK